MDIGRILLKIRPNCFYSVNGNTYEGLVWENYNTEQKPSIEEINQAWEELKNEFIWEATRMKRDRLLQECDYTQLEDFNGNKEAWKIYRNTLRNIPQTFGDTESVVWPTKPS